MSDYYLFNLRLRIDAGTPEALHVALTKRARGETPSKEDVATLPGMAQVYLLGAKGPGDGVHLYEPTKIFDPTLPAGQPQYRDGYLLRLSQTFHDDEYFNGGMFYPYWLMSLAANGQLGTMQQINGDDPPVVLTRVGSLLHETSLAYHPADLWPIPGQEPPDEQTPLVIKETRSHVIDDLMKDLSMFADAYDYE
jgi:hypothetical protein